MVRRRQRGFTLLEVVVSLALFGVFLYIIGLLTAEMRGYEKRLPVDFLAHPQTLAVVARIRKDVQDATAPYYPSSYDKYAQSPKTLILYSLQESGFAETIVWDFTTDGEAHRRAFSAGAQTSEWVAHGVPRFKIGDFVIDQVLDPEAASQNANRPDGVRLQAIDKKGLHSIDEILQPRAHH